MTGVDILERKVIHAGKIFIKAGEENSRAYVIQHGKVASYFMKGDQRIDVAEHSIGTIIGETCLVLDEPIEMNYEALVDTTVVTITRQDFERKLGRADKTIRTLFGHIINKLYEHEGTAMIKAEERAKIDDDALGLLQSLIGTLPPDKKFQYEQALLPHLNGLIKEIKNLKGDVRHEEQARVAQERIAEIQNRE